MHFKNKTFYTKKLGIIKMLTTLLPQPLQKLLQLYTVKIVK